MNARRVLLVMDDSQLGAAVRSVLEGLGHPVEVVTDGATAAAAFERSAPELAVIGLCAPGEDSVSVCKRLHAAATPIDVPLLIATSDDDDSMNRAFLAGATDVIPTPIRPRFVQQQVRFLLRQRSEHRRSVAALRGEARRLANAERLAAVGSWEWEPRAGTVESSPGLRRLLALSTQTGPSRDALLRCVHPEDRALVEKACDEASKGAAAVRLEHRIVRPGGAVRVVLHQIEAIARDDGVPLVAGALEDVTDQKTSVRRLAELADRDTVTGLAERVKLFEQLAAMLARSARDSGPALLLIGVERFARLRQSLGRRASDRLLAEIAQRLTRCAGPAEIAQHGEACVARVGADTFAVALERAGSAERVATAARRMLDTLAQPFAFEGNEFHVSATLGFALAPVDGDAPDVLLASAEAALSEARQVGRRGYGSRRRVTHEDLRRARAVEARLRVSLGSDDITLHYQPIVDATSGLIVKTEALARWTDPVLGPVAPGEFVPLAEETGLVVPLGRRLLWSACRQLRRWDELGLNLTVAVNVSPIQLQHPDFVADLRAALTETGVRPKHLDLEITEGLLVGDDPAVTASLATVKDLGLGLIIDDFGVGYSSLSYLQRLQVDALKIDRAFVARIEDRSGGAALVAAIIAMAHRLGIVAIAEGVENFAQEDFLRSEGCDLLQGFSLGIPDQAQALERRLQQEASRRVD